MYVDSGNRVIKYCPTCFGSIVAGYRNLTPIFMTATHEIWTVTQLMNTVYIEPTSFAHSFAHSFRVVQRVAMRRKQCANIARKYCLACTHTHYRVNSSRLFMYCTYICYVYIVCAANVTANKHTSQHCQNVRILSTTYPTYLVRVREPACIVHPASFSTGAHMAACVGADERDGWFGLRNEVHCALEQIVPWNLCVCVLDVCALCCGVWNKQTGGKL